MADNGRRGMKPWVWAVLILAMIAGAVLGMVFPRLLPAHERQFHGAGQLILAVAVIVVALGARRRPGPRAPGYPWGVVAIGVGLCGSAIGSVLPSNPRWLMAGIMIVAAACVLVGCVGVVLNVVHALRRR